MSASKIFMKKLYIVQGGRAVTSQYHLMTILSSLLSYDYGDILEKRIVKWRASATEGVGG
jgi:hypothetical protein